MGFPKSYASTILSNVFKAGNKIALLSSVGTDTYTEVSGTGYERYTIVSGDFLVSQGVVTTAKHILFGLAEGDGGWGTAAGFAVLSGSTLMYLAEFKEAKPIGKDTVPVFKKYLEKNSEGEQEGIRVTLDVVTAASLDVTETS